jgi:hypothetical protein
VRAAEHGVDRPGEAHPLAERGELGRQRLREEAVPVEHVGEGAGIERREAAREIGHRAHRS